MLWGGFLCNSIFIEDKPCHFLGKASGSLRPWGLYIWNGSKGFWIRVTVFICGIAGKILIYFEITSSYQSFAFKARNSLKFFYIHTSNFNCFCCCTFVLKQVASGDYFMLILPLSSSLLRQSEPYVVNSNFRFVNLLPVCDGGEQLGETFCCEKKLRFPVIKVKKVVFSGPH